VLGLEESEFSGASMLLSFGPSVEIVAMNFLVALLPHGKEL
jgi:hypothetical protein